MCLLSQIFSNDLMAHHDLFFSTSLNHPLFVSSVVIKYNQEVIKKSSINFGRIYLTILYKEFTTINCHGREVPNPKIQLRPVSNFFSASAEKGSKSIILGIKPTRWFAITGKPAYLFNENVIDMQDVLPQDLLESLYKSCEEVMDPDRVVEIVDQHLNEYYSDWQKPCPIDGIIEEIFENQGMVNIKDLLEKYPYARTTLGEYFKKYIGYSPKFFIRLIHFNNIIREIENSGSKLSELLHSYDFYDYAHFKKDFQIFTGVTPVEYPSFKNTSLLEDVLREIDYNL